MVFSPPWSGVCIARVPGGLVAHVGALTRGKPPARRALSRANRAAHTRKWMITSKNKAQGMF